MECTKNCLNCTCSFSEETPDGDVLHCCEREGEVVLEDFYCEEWN